MNTRQYGNKYHQYKLIYILGQKITICIFVNYPKRLQEPGYIYAN